jgi:hypothetical protein
MVNDAKAGSGIVCMKYFSPADVFGVSSFLRESK